ncbi:hypothetical protein INT43_003350 [Umbelopsis isabellina]|uniref:BTB domain-containing protein n=1 Tax=Mortierella isabellina TaxID=91625 RepID=A0A8H7PQ18_MORIS|nr:hypothetical protein INT43_003350 [Umbelopsis isabellina]
MTSIFKAVYENNVESIKQFIADANRTTPSSKDPQTASQPTRRKSNVPIVNINKRSILGRTALHLAASWNRMDILQLLVDCPHTNVNIRDRENGWTALHRALYAGHIESALILSSQEDIDIFIKDFEGNTALDLYNSTIEGTSPSPRTIENIKRDNHDGDAFHGLKSSFWSLEESHSSTGATDIFTWGYNTNFVLGHRDSENRTRPDRVHLNLVTQQIPQVLRRPAYVIMSMIMSKFHSAIITSEPENNLQLCGFGGARLGFGNEDTQFLFKPVNGIHDQVVVAALGRDHTVVVTRGGDVYSFGINNYGQLGYDTEQKQGQRIPQYAPRKIAAPSIKKEHIIGAAASSVHSAVFTETDLYTFGLNQGQLGYYPANGDFVQVVPRKVSFLPSGARIIQVACIDNATVVLTASHDVFVLFNNGHQKVVFPMQRFPSDFVAYTAAPNFIVKIIAGGDDYVGAISNMGDLFIWTITTRKGSTSGQKTKTDAGFVGVENQRSRAAIVPRRIWALRKSHLTLADACIGQEGSVIVCTTSGHVFVGSPRKVPKKNKNLVEKKLYKFNKIPLLQRCIMVAASPTGAFAALRAEKPLKSVDVPPSTLAMDLLTSLPHIQNAYRLQKLQAEEDKLLRHLSEERLKIPFFIETEAIDAVPEISENAPVLDWDKYITSDIADPTIDAYIKVGQKGYQCHQVILAARSAVFEKAFSNLHIGGDSNVVLNHNSGRTAKFVKSNNGKVRSTVEILIEGIHMESVWFFLDFIYSDQYEHPMNAFYASSKHHTGDLAVRTKLQTNISADVLQKELIYLADVFKLPTLQDSVSSSFNARPRPTLTTDIGMAQDREKSRQYLKDVLLELEDAVLDCHEVILRQRSTFFDTVFDPNRTWLSNRRQQSSKSATTIDLNHFDHKTMDIVIQYLYNDNRDSLFNELVDSSTNSIFNVIIGVLAVADELMIDTLKVVCQIALLKLVTSKNVLVALEIADLHRAEHVKAACLDFIAHNLDYFLEAGVLEEFSPSLVEDIQSEVQKLQSCKAFLSRASFSANGQRLGLDNEPELNIAIQMDFTEQSMWATPDEIYYTVRPKKPIESFKHSTVISNDDDDLIFQQDEDILSEQTKYPQRSYSSRTSLKDTLYETPTIEHDEAEFPALGNSCEGMGISKPTSIPTSKRGWSFQSQDNSPKQTIRELLDNHDPAPATKSSPTRPVIIPKKLSQRERRKLQQQEAANIAETVNTPKPVWGKPIQSTPAPIMSSSPGSAPVGTPPAIFNRKPSMAEILEDEKAQKLRGKQAGSLPESDYQEKKFFESREAAEQSLRSSSAMEPSSSTSSNATINPMRKASTTYKPTMISRRQKDITANAASEESSDGSAIRSFADIQNQQLKESMVRGKKFKKSLIRIQQEEQAIEALMEFYTQTIDIGTGEWFRIARAETQ